MYRLHHLMLALAALLLLSVTPAVAKGPSPPKLYSYVLNNKSDLPAEINGVLDGYTPGLCTAFAHSACRYVVDTKYSRIVVKVQKGDFTLQQKCSVNISYGDNQMVLVIMDRNFNCSATTY